MFNGKRLAMVAMSILLVNTVSQASFGELLVKSSPYIASVGSPTIIKSVVALTPVAALAVAGIFLCKSCINPFKKGYAVYQRETLLNAGKFFLAAGTNINTIKAFAYATKEIFVEGAKEMQYTYRNELSPIVKEAYNYLKNWTGTIHWRDFSGKALEAIKTFFRKGVENMTPSEILAAKVALTGGSTLAANVAGELAAEVGGELLKGAAEQVKSSVTSGDIAFGTLAAIAMNGAQAVWSTAVNALATIAPFI